jgi:hypothetical protein
MYAGADVEVVGEENYARSHRLVWWKCHWLRARYSIVDGESVLALDCARTLAYLPTCLMDLRSAIHKLVDDGRALMERLRSPEGDSIGRVDLHILEVQLYLLDKEVVRRQHVNRSTSPDDKRSRYTQPDFPPFVSDKAKK